MVVDDLKIVRKKCLNWKNSKEIVVATQGVFDLLHFAHIEYLNIASEMGAKLIIAMDSDEKVRQRKGPGRPVFKWDERARQLEELGIINIIFSKSPFVSDIHYVLEITPDIFVVSDDSEFNSIENKILASKNIEVICIPRDRRISTTKLIKKKHNKTNARGRQKSPLVPRSTFCRR